MRRLPHTDELNLNQRALSIYNKSPFVLYEENGIYYCAYNEKATPYYIGKANDVESFLLEFANIK